MPSAIRVGINPIKLIIQISTTVEFSETEAVNATRYKVVDGAFSVATYL